LAEDYLRFMFMWDFTRKKDDKRQKYLLAEIRLGGMKTSREKLP
jgi:hypothetical protein